MAANQPKNELTVIKIKHQERFFLSLSLFLIFGGRDGEITGLNTQLNSYLRDREYLLGGRSVKLGRYEEQ